MRLKLLLILVLIMCSTFHLEAQHKVKIYKENFRTSEPGFESAWVNVKQGNKAFKAGIGFYKEAMEKYQSALQYNLYHPELNYKMGVCCLFSDKKMESLNYFKRAYEFKEDVAPDIHFMIGRGYHYNHQFDNAIEEYRKYLDGLSEKERKKLNIDFDKLIQECENGKKLIQDTVRVQIVNIGNNINSSEDDYNSVITSNGNRMYFTSRRQYLPNTRRNHFDNKFNEDIYVSYFNNGIWELAQNIGKSVNSKFNDAALAVSPDAQQLYIYNGVKKRGDIYVSNFNKRGKWGSPTPISGKFNSRDRETTLSITADEQTLFFIRTSKKNSVGGSDIFYATKKANGKWDKPQNLGNVINTSYDEEAVFIEPDGNTIYFSSKGHNTMGGFDIFRSTADENKQWSEPQNLGFPVNSADDDLFYITTSDTAVSYFTSIREDTYGDKDIYKIAYLPPPVEEDTLPEIVEEPEPVIDTIKFIVTDTIRIVEEVPVEKPDPTILLKGTVMDESDISPVLAKIEIIDMDLNNVIATSISEKENGNYSIKLDERKNYGVEITAQGYMLFLDIIDIPEDLETKEIIRNFVLKKVKVGETIILKNIFFETNKAVLTPESYVELGRVLKLLESNPTLRIEISGHTDNVGSYEVNQRLSEARAKAVVDFLVGSGTDSSRLEYAGYAFSQPVAPNNTPEGRAQNRRVEFKILSK
jgi:outer membrane protein OmpA-like peptidoglycan-associated protein